jgi:hypothetical protein
LADLTGDEGSHLFWKTEVAQNEDSISKKNGHTHQWVTTKTPTYNFVCAGTTFCPKMPPKTTPTSIIFVFGSFENYLYPHDSTTTSTEHTQFQQRQMKSLACLAKESKELAVASLLLTQNS